MTESVSFSHRSPHTADACWGVLRAFTEIDWLIGPGNYTVGEQDGRPARIMNTEPPVVEYLLGSNDDRRELRYGILKCPFVPVDNYEAAMSVQPDSEGCLVTLSSTFNLAEVPLAQVQEMLTSGYRLLVTRMDESLA